MTIAKRTPIFQCLLLAGVISLTACGGGGGGKKQPPIDTTPNAITLAASTNVEPGTIVTSAPVTISGINTASPVSIVGGEYSISGGAFTANPGSITNGQTLTVRITSSDKTNTPKEAVVTVGGVSAKFAVTTAADLTPEAFTFAPKNDAQLNAEYTSDPITVSGIDVAVPVSVTGGLYSINGGEFTSAAGTVSAGQAITVKTTAAAKTETAQEAVLTIGGVSGTFSVTTIQDTMPPVAEFKFPTPYTMSEAASVKVRGTATDDNAITNVKVVVRSYKLETPTVTLSTTEFNATPKSEANGVKDFSSWTVDVPLTALAENEIKVVATDVRNNSIAVDAANKVAIRQAPITVAFPDSNNPLRLPTGGITVDKIDGRDRLLVADTLARTIISVSLMDGKRTIFKELNSNNRISGLVIDETAEEPVLYAHESPAKNILKMSLFDGSILNSYHCELCSEPREILLDEVGGIKHLIVVNEGANSINSDVISFNLQTEIFSTISSDANQPLMPSTRGFALDETRNRYLVTVRNRAENLYGIYAVDRTTGERRAFSTNEIGGGEMFTVGATLTGLDVDPSANAAYVLDNGTSRLFSIDLLTGDRRVISDLGYGEIDGEVFHAGLTNISVSPSNQYAFITDISRASVRIVDLISGEKVFLSKPKNDY